jgi:hypothetical protein
MCKPLYLALIFLVLFPLSGCEGGGTGMPSPSPTPSAQIAGNYSFTLGTLGPIGGFMNTTAGNVIGKMGLSDAITACTLGGFDAAGSINSAGQLALTAAGATLTLNGIVSSDGKTISGATFNMIGLPGCTASGQATGFQVQELSGVYSGTLTLTHAGVATPINWSGALSQQLANTGFVLLTGGDATVTGFPAACGFTTSTFSIAGGGFVFGAYRQFWRRGQWFQL